MRAIVSSDRSAKRIENPLEAFQHLLIDVNESFKRGMSELIIEIRRFAGNLYSLRVIPAQGQPRTELNRIPIRAWSEVIHTTVRTLHPF